MWNEQRQRQETHWHTQMSKEKKEPKWIEVKVFSGI